jgi:rubrerythrin
MEENRLSKNGILLNLKQSLNIEYKALEGYEDFLKIIKDKADEDIIRLILEDERKHVKLVEEMIAMVNEHYKEE